ncbi:HNH endonuclease [Roseateles sp. GG27B]
MEVHHLNPISEQSGPAAVNPRTDLIVLCSNCHSIVHRNRPKPLTLAELAKIAS